MSSGKVHKKQNLTVFYLITAIIIVAICNDYNSFYFLFWLPAGLLFNTYLAHGDFDQERQGLLGLYWRPFAIAVSHRSPLSHWPGIGTFVKDIYLLPVFLVTGFFLSNVLNVSILKLINSESRNIITFFAGQCVADGLHWIFDLESTNMKKSFTKLFKRGAYARTHFTKTAKD